MRLCVDARSLCFNRGAVFFKAATETWCHYSSYAFSTAGLRLCCGEREVGVARTGHGYFLAFILHNGRFVFTTTRLEQSPVCAHTQGCTDEHRCHHSYIYVPPQRPFYSHFSPFYYRILSRQVKKTKNRQTGKSKLVLSETTDM